MVILAPAEATLPMVPCEEPGSYLADTLRHAPMNRCYINYSIKRMLKVANESLELG